MKKDQIFEIYIDAITAFEAGLVSASQYLLEDTLALAEKYYSETLVYHHCHISILENLAKVYIFIKNHEIALEILHRARKIDPTNMRILYKLFMFHTQTLPDEKLALKIYLIASDLYNSSSIFDINNEIYKLFCNKGELIKNKRKSYLMIEENSQVTEIKPQNLVKQLPIEILAEIFKKLDSSTLINLLLVCKHWRTTILGSPQIVGMFNFKKGLTYKSLVAYLRLFDQRIYTSEIIIDQLTLISNKDSLEFDTFKLLLSSKLQTRTLTYKISNDFQNQLTKMIKLSKSHLFNNIENLNFLISSKSTALGVLPAFLQFTTNLRKLSIKLENINSRNITPIIFRNKVTLKKLEELEIQCKTFDYISKTKLHLFLDMPNLQSLVIDTISFSIIDSFLSNVKELKSLKILRYPIRELINVFDLDENCKRITEKFSKLEKLEFSNNDYHGGNYSITEEMSNRIEFKSLKTLSFQKTFVNTKELTYFLECSQNQLENLFIEGRPSLRYEVNGVEHSISNPTFSLKRIIETIPHIKSIKLCDNKINPRIFSSMMFEIATLSKHYHLKYFEIAGEVSDVQTYTILFLSIKDKLSIDHLRLSGRPNEQLKLFIDIAIANGDVKRVDFSRL
ncbi:hypothetical protein C6P40_003744 [Pichia californica]|uniref:F-box domain-containing protein n=1 Tax=Pichia californica TaxID=460514 RepID=A0A9P6WIV6_9ASCO|nr:hypothetical protein C6P42_003471 [[Candida] californica]KAG0686588.1 hypothetical protein C6P40_003744 [[Candida] californica]